MKHLEVTIRKLVCRHSGFRTRYRNEGKKEEPKWMQYIVPPINFSRGSGGVMEEHVLHDVEPKDLGQK